MAALINDYTREEVCVYKVCSFFIRDNGAIYHQCKEVRERSKQDEEWAFFFFPKTAYVFIGKELVHRIICLEYNGVPYGGSSVVADIDINQCFDNRIHSFSTEEDALQILHLIPSCREKICGCNRGQL